MKLRRAGLVLSSIGVALLLISGPGTRFGVFGFRTGLLLFATALLAAIAAFTITVVGLIVPKLRGGDGKGFALPLVMSLSVMAGPGRAWRFTLDPFAW